MSGPCHGDVSGVPLHFDEGVDGVFGVAATRANYREALTQYVEPLLRHSIRYWELTLQMIERTGVDTEWRARIEADLTRVRQQLGTLLGP